MADLQAMPPRKPPSRTMSPRKGSPRKAAAASPLAPAVHDAAGAAALSPSPADPSPAPLPGAVDVEASAAALNAPSAVLAPPEPRRQQLQPVQQRQTPSPSPPGSVVIVFDAVVADAADAAPSTAPTPAVGSHAQAPLPQPPLSSSEQQDGPRYAAAAAAAATGMRRPLSPVQLSFSAAPEAVESRGWPRVGAVPAVVSLSPTRSRGSRNRVAPEPSTAPPLAPGASPKYEVLKEEPAAAISRGEGIVLVAGDTSDGDESDMPTAHDSETLRSPGGRVASTTPLPPRYAPAQPIGGPSTQLLRSPSVPADIAAARAARMSELMRVQSRSALTGAAVNPWLNPSLDPRATLAGAHADAAAVMAAAATQQRILHPQPGLRSVLSANAVLPGRPPVDNRAPLTHTPLPFVPPVDAGFRLAWTGTAAGQSSEGDTLDESAESSSTARSPVSGRPPTARRAIAHVAGSAAPVSFASPESERLVQELSPALRLPSRGAPSAAPQYALAPAASVLGRNPLFQRREVASLGPVSLPIQQQQQQQQGEPHRQPQVLPAARLAAARPHGDVTSVDELPALRGLNRAGAAHAAAARAAAPLASTAPSASAPDATSAVARVPTLLSVSELLATLQRGRGFGGASAAPPQQARPRSPSPQPTHRRTPAPQTVAPVRDADVFAPHLAARGSGRASPARPATAAATPHAAFEVFDDSPQYSSDGEVAVEATDLIGAVALPSRYLRSAGSSRWPTAIASANASAPGRRMRTPSPPLNTARQSRGVVSADIQVGSLMQQGELRRSGSPSFPARSEVPVAGTAAPRGSAGTSRGVVLVRARSAGVIRRRDRDDAGHGSTQAAAADVSTRLREMLPAPGPASSQSGAPRPGPGWRRQAAPAWQTDAVDTGTGTPASLMMSDAATVPLGSPDSGAVGGWP